MSRHKTSFVLCAVLLAISTSSANAQGSQVSSPVDLARQAERLRPGQWVWAPQIAPRGPLTVYVDISRQIATIYRNGVRIGVSTVSSGKPGHETPTGVFAILQKDANHHSSTYNNAPMRFQQRLTWDGVALHAGGLPGYPESHGCVHLPLTFARLLFADTEMGGTVIVAGRAGSASLVSDAGVLAPQGEQGVTIDRLPLADNEPYRWNPEAAPTGPMTIIVSRSDQRIVVSRNGVEIGRARVSLPLEDFATQVYTYAPQDDGQPLWIHVGIPTTAEKGQPLGRGILSRLQMPRAFFAALRQAIVPGTTVLVTQAPVLPRNSGKRMTIIASR